MTTIEAFKEPLLFSAVGVEELVVARLVRATVDTSCGIRKWTGNAGDSGCGRGTGGDGRNSETALEQASGHTTQATGQEPLSDGELRNTTVGETFLGHLHVELVRRTFIKDVLVISVKLVFGGHLRGSRCCAVAFLEHEEIRARSGDEIEAIDVLKRWSGDEKLLEVRPGGTGGINDGQILAASELDVFDHVVSEDGGGVECRSGGIGRSVANHAVLAPSPTEWEGAIEN